MRKNQPIYRDYLEALVKSLLTERELNGKTDFDSIQGVDKNGNYTYYIPYNIKEVIYDEIP